MLFFFHTESAKKYVIFDNNGGIYTGYFRTKQIRLIDFLPVKRYTYFVYVLRDRMQKFC